VRVTRERSKTKKKLLRSARRPDGILRELFYSGLFYSVLFNSCNKAEEPIFGRLRNLWESFAFRVVCDPNTRSLVKFYPKWEPYQICLNLNKRENATFVRRDCVTVLICEVVNLWFVCVSLFKRVVLSQFLHIVAFLGNCSNQTRYFFVFHTNKFVLCFY